MFDNLFKPEPDTEDEGIMREDNLFKPISDTEDEGIMREILLDFYMSSRRR